MPLDSSVVISQSGAIASRHSGVNGRAAEAIESVEHTEAPIYRSPARGILIGVMIGIGAWTAIFAAVALARSIFFS